LPVVACPPSRAIETSSPTTTVPPTMTTSLPAGLAAKLSYYSDDMRSLSPVLGPSGWHCWVQTGADGSGTLAIFWPQSTGGIFQFQTERNAYAGQGVQAVVATWTPACQGCVYDEVCSLIPAAVAELGQVTPNCSSKPPQEQVSWIRGSATSTSAPTDDVVAFHDPPGVFGTGLPSGGTNPADGVLLYRFDAHLGRTSSETCTLFAIPASPCTTLLNDFVARNWGIW